MMDKLWRRAWLPALIFSVGGAIHTTAASAQDSRCEARQRRHDLGGGRITSSASRSDSGVKEKTNDGNRAVTAPAKPGGTTHGVGAAQAASPNAPTTTGATAPRPTHARPTHARKKHSAKTDSGAPVETHSVVKDNPKLPSLMPPRRSSPSAPPPNQHPAEPQNP